MRNKRVLFIMLLATAVGIITTFWFLLQTGYKHGAVSNRGQEAFGYLERWMLYPSLTDRVHISFMGVGFIFVIILSIMRMRFFWWPVHAIGYPLAGGWVIGFFWFSLFISWLIKWMLLRLGGLKSYQKALPFFLGLILGEFSIGSFWSIVEKASGKTIYTFWP